MNGEHISRALNHLPENMVMEAMAVSKTPSKLLRFTRIAACLAVITSLLLWLPAILREDAPSKIGKFSVTAYASDLSESTVLSKNTVLPHSYEWGLCSWAPGLPILLQFEDDRFDTADISFRITVSGGGIYIDASGKNSITGGSYTTMPREFSVANNTYIFWSEFYNPYADEHLEAAGNICYIDILMLCKEDIVGYCVLRLDRVSPDSVGFKLSMLESVVFSSDHVGVAETYVQQKMEEVKQK